MTQTPFSGIRLLTWPGEVMAPRPATEALVEAAAAIVGTRAARVADVGTGSGAIAIALALRAPDARIWATDTSPAAVALAQANVAAHGLDDRIAVLPADLLDGVPHGLDLIVANLPYLPDSVQPERPELSSEPSEAVFAPGDGLGLYRRLVAAAERALRPDGTLLIQLHRRVVAFRFAHKQPGTWGNSLIKQRAASGLLLASNRGASEAFTGRHLRSLRQAVPRRGAVPRERAGRRQVPALQALHAARARRFG